MQDYNARGTIFRILTKAPGVFIFVFKTNEQHSFTVKAKKFRPKNMDEQTFLAQCEAFAEGQTIFIRNSRIVTEQVLDREGGPMHTTLGHPVYAPVINVDFIAVEAASIHYAPKQASSPPPAEQVDPQVPVPSAPPRPAPAPVPAPAQKPASQSVDQNHDDIPGIPFLQL